MVLVRKLYAGADSHGNTWSTDRATVEVPADVAAELVSIPDGGFTVVEEPAPRHEPDEDTSDQDELPGLDADRTEIDEAPAAAPRRGRRPKSLVEE